MDTQEKVNNLVETLSSESLAYRSAVARNSGTGNIKTRLMNLLFNNLELILQQLSNINVLNEKVKTLTEALTEADEEYSDLNRKYKALLNETSSKTTSTKKKSKGSDQGA